MREVCSRLLAPPEAGEAPSAMDPSLIYPLLWEITASPSGSCWYAPTAKLFSATASEIPSWGGAIRRYPIFKLLLSPCPLSIKNCCGFVESGSSHQAMLGCLEFAMLRSWPHSRFWWLNHRLHVPNLSLQYLTVESEIEGQDHRTTSHNGPGLT